MYIDMCDKVLVVDLRGSIFTKLLGIFYKNNKLDRDVAIRS